MMMLAILLAGSPTAPAAEQAACISNHMTVSPAAGARWLNGGGGSDSPADRAVKAAFTRAMDACTARHRWTPSQAEAAVRYAAARFLHAAAVAPLERRGITEAEVAGYVASLDPAARTRIRTHRLVLADADGLTAFARRAGVGVERLDGAAARDLGYQLRESVAGLITMQDAPAAFPHR